ncbi:HlyD family type I secretion periplasmic adaptor subunit [Shumkonia mesophila]|uniref:HlyD family type I secretion periplasmic adaptor subunit n=1 Tax=Shumkonia mesophila TaxID=2838854 RepID=UPI0029343577|nr:HlyD family type I secretion periplasmic adaptor subunit [Shumkonia mesophila]
MSRLDHLMDSHPLPTWRTVAWPVMILLGALIVWSNYFELDEVSIATGEVIPRGNIKVIQHLEGGIVQAIHVEDGDVVREGQLLLQLGLGVSGVNREELETRRDSDLLVKARLEAETQGTPLAIPEDLQNRRPIQAVAEQRSYVARQQQLDAKIGVQLQLIRQRELEVEEFNARMRALQDRKRELSSPAGSLQQQIRQKELEIKELETQRTTSTNNLRLLRERFAMSTKLVADGLISKMDHLQLESEVKSLEGQINGLNQSIPRARAALDEVRGILKEQVESIVSDINSLTPSISRAQAAVSEAQQRVGEERIRFRREAQEELVKTEQSIARTRELLSQATEQKIRTDIRSPIEGIIKNLRYHTIGGVVKAGEPIMEIVPTGENVVIEAKLNPTDRGYVRVGQATTVKISTYDYSRYGGLEGIVTMVAPDSSADDKGVPFFRVLVETDKTYLGQKQGELPIIPGMEATVDIHTGTRTFLEYLIRPVLKLRHEAFRER